MMPRIVLALIVSTLVLGGTGCTDSSSTEGPPRFVTTIYPFALLLEPIVRGRGQVVTLLEAGDSPHTYEPRPSDAQATSGSAALFYGAETLDGWAAALPAPRHVPLLKLIPPAQRLSMPGEGNVADPHFWTDPLAVRSMLPALTDTLCALDARGCATYRANADSLATRLTTLDAELQAQMRPVQNLPVMLSQPFFRYFLHRYGPRLVGVVEPHPAGTPSPQALQAIIAEVERVEVQAMLVQTQLSPRLARMVSEATGLPLITLNPLGDPLSTPSYGALLRYNAQTIRGALRPVTPS